MKTADVAGILLCMAIGTAYADKNGNHADHDKRGNHLHPNKHEKWAPIEPIVVPPGLEKQGKVPPGLAKQGKIPPGWSKGNKTEKDVTTLPTIGNIIDNTLSVPKK